MERKYKHLCSPITVGRVTFRNRMFSTPMGGTDITKDGCIGPMSTKFYEYRSKGGAGAVTVSECMVHPETDGSHAYHIDLAVPGNLASHTMTADAIKRHGCIACHEAFFRATARIHVRQVQGYIGVRAAFARRQLTYYTI